MDRELRKPYYFDLAVVLVFLLLTLCVLIFTAHEILILASTFALKAFIVISAGSAGVFATASLIAVIAHLHRSRESLYREDLAHLKEKEAVNDRST
jgi:hypothetical protein